ncbi:MAG TPA: NAD(FAD)-dependent dehydrogenase [Thermoplasmatales archaeon]|nr:NAD(FAD)-dependent dehydrogenase [Thermoplasmatales archaeon]
MSESIVVVGCGAVGGTAAQFARKTNRKAKITVFESGKYPQYSKCALPHLIAGKVKDIIEFSEEWFERSKIDLYLETTVTEIDIDRKIAVATDGKETHEVQFDSLVIATGATSFIPPIEGITENGMLKKGVFTLRTLDDAKSILSYLDNVDNVIIVGAGMIGLEMAETLKERKKEVKVVELLPSILPATLDQDMAEIVLGRIEREVEIFTNHKVKEIKGKGKVDGVVIESNEGNEREMETDMVIVATGVRPNIELAKSMGCEIGKAIKIDKRTMTSRKDVYAAGDCTEYFDFVTGKSFPIGLGSIGVRQGIVAGINAAGGDAELPDGFIQTRTTKIFGLEIAAVGPTSNDISDRKPLFGKFKGSSLPDYFPGGEEITVKVLIDSDDGTIIAGQAVGANASLRINTVACAVFNRMKVDDFVRLETAYAPPVAPTLDAMTIAADVAKMRYGRR